MASGLATSLEEAGLGHLCEDLCQKTSLEDLHASFYEYRSGETKGNFLNVLKDLGIASLPERQKVRDMLKSTASQEPPPGSAAALRKQYSTELQRFPFATVEAERHMRSDYKGPTRPSGPARHMVVAAPGVSLRQRRAQDSQPAVPSLLLSTGTVVAVHDDSYDAASPTWCAWVSAPDGDGMFATGWMNMADLLPCDEAGVQVAQPARASYEVQRGVQIGFLRAFSQVSVQRALATAKESGGAMAAKELMTKVRGPVIAEFGYPPTDDGLALLVSTRVHMDNPREPYDTLADREYKLIVETHFQVVNLMAGQPPGKDLVDALEQRPRVRAGTETLRI